MKLDTATLKKYLLLNMPYAVVFIVLLQVISKLPFSLPLPDVLTALIAAAVMRLMVYVCSFAR